MGKHNEAIEARAVWVVWVLCPAVLALVLALAGCTAQAGSLRVFVGAGNGNGAPQLRWIGLEQPDVLEGDTFYTEDLTPAAGCPAPSVAWNEPAAATIAIDDDERLAITFPNAATTGWAGCYIDVPTEDAVLTAHVGISGSVDSAFYGWFGGDDLDTLPATSDIGTVQLDEGTQTTLLGRWTDFDTPNSGFNAYASLSHFEHFYVRACMDRDTTGQNFYGCWSATGQYWSCTEPIFYEDVNWPSTGPLHWGIGGFHDGTNTDDFTIFSRMLRVDLVAVVAGAGGLETPPACLASVGAWSDD
jgi:hypothetical protein